MVLDHSQHPNNFSSGCRNLLCQKLTIAVDDDDAEDVDVDDAADADEVAVAVDEGVDTAAGGGRKYRGARPLLASSKSLTFNLCDSLDLWLFTEPLQLQDTLNSFWHSVHLP